MALQLNLTIKQGETADELVIPAIDLQNEDGTPFDLTGWVGQAMLRKQYSDAAPAAEFSVGLGVSDIQLTLTAVQTAALAAGDYVYDAKISKDGIVRFVLYGRVVIAPQATYP